MNIKIVRPVKADFEELKRLFTASIHDAFRREGIDKTFSDEIPGDIQFQLDALQRDFDSDGREEHYFIAKLDSRIVGTCAIGTTSGGVMRAFKLAAPTIPEMKSLYVLPEYQGRGIGLSLIDHTLEYMQEAGMDEFLFECGYKIAQALWMRRFGEPAIVKQDYFSEGAHLMFWRCRVIEQIRRVAAR